MSKRKTWTTRLERASAIQDFIELRHNTTATLSPRMRTPAEYENPYTTIDKGA